MRNWKYSEHDGKHIINDDRGVLIAMVVDAQTAELIVRQQKELAEAVTQIGELKRQLRRSDREWASATNEVVRLQDQLGEKDRTIDMLTEQITAEVSISAKAIAERDLFKGSFEHWNKEAHRVVDENNKLRKVLEVATDALNGILNGEWSETLDDQFLEVFTTRRINPSQIADEALLEINRELEALGE